LTSKGYKNNSPQLLRLIKGETMTKWVYIAVLSLALNCLKLFPQDACPDANSLDSDFAQLHRYSGKNELLQKTMAPVSVVFLGDSIFEYWGSRAGVWFDNPAWINRGIGGQTTSQLLLRERTDGFALHPHAIVLEGGSNDIRLGFSPANVRDNIESMGELAQMNHLSVFVTAMTPVCDCFRPLTGLRTVEKITRLNILLKQLCHDRHWSYIDLNSPLSDSTGHMRKELTFDGVHPNEEGYNLLAPIITRVLNAFD
jgi:lysophospholipase L1-like esterase